MKHAGKARAAAWKLIGRTLVWLGVALLLALVARLVGATVLIIPARVLLWFLFGLFTLFFFRDPEARTPSDPKLIVSPGHGKVDVIGETTEPAFMGGPCKRVSMFLSVLDVHVQNAPVDGKIVFFKHTGGQFLNALRTDSAAVNENILIGFAPKEWPGDKIGVRLVAGVLARRIVAWVAAGDEVARGDRLGLIQFGSRVEIYLPLSANIRVKLGDKVVGGETVIATFR
jgi:phosphatidylserine decarboxylase